ncbi:MAG: N-acetylmuramoyl-L-alanine amidase, partial [Candidatus Saccharibacteria bacterium]
MRKIKYLCNKLLIIYMIIVLSPIFGVFTHVSALSKCDLEDIKAGRSYADTCSPDEDLCPKVDIGGTSSNTGTGTSNGYPIKVPVIKDAAKLASAIDQYIKSSQPNSPMNGMGKYFVQGGMRAGINPVLVVAHAQHESGFGTAKSKFNDLGAHNAYGRTAGAGQPSVSTNRDWYKWESWEKSLYASAYPASGKADQPDDQFQYIARKFAKSLNESLQVYLGGDPTRGLPPYAPASDGNNVAAYIKDIQDTTSKISVLAGDAIDLKQLGSASTGSIQPQTGGSSSAQTVVAIDPGHGAVVPEYTDPITGLGDRETANTPEREDVQEIANQIKTGLEKTGYKVVMLKTNAADAISKRQRVDAAKAANANIGISIHTDSESGGFGNWGEVWPQFVGGYRQSSSDPSKKTVFTNAAIATKSDDYSKIIASE